MEFLCFLLLFIYLLINLSRSLDRKMALPGKTTKKLRGLLRYLYFNFESKSSKAFSTLRQRSSFISTVGLPSTLICHQNGATRKGFSDWRNLKTPAFCFHVGEKHFEYGRCSRDYHVISLTQSSSNRNPYRPVTVVF